MNRPAGAPPQAAPAEAERAAHRAEQALALSERKFRTLSDALPVGVYHTDADGRCTYTNPRWQMAAGLSFEQSLGEGWTQAIHADDRAEVFARWNHSAATGARFSMQFRMQRPDGSVREIDSQAQPLLDADHHIVGYVGTAEDVTDQRAAERNLRHAHELARLAAERREMFDLLAHEVRQPLNRASAALQGAAVLLAQKGEAQASARLARTQAAIADVQNHIENTLALSTLLAGAPVDSSPDSSAAARAPTADSPAATRPPALPEVEADIDAVLAVAVAELPAGERQRVHLSRHTAARSALMDPTLVRLALRNLLGNAVRHTPAATPVQLRVSDSESPLALLIDVIDEGGGLPPELLPRLFERGTRARHADGRVSHGLGLFIAHRALQVQGGELRLLHSGVQGTALRLVLPQGRSE